MVQCRGLTGKEGGGGDLGTIFVAKQKLREQLCKLVFERDVINLE